MIFSTFAIRSTFYSRKVTLRLRAENNCLAHNTRLNRRQNHGSESIGQAASFARSVVVALVPDQRDRDDKLRVHDAATAVDLLYVLQYSHAHLHDKRNRRVVNFARYKRDNDGIRLRDESIDHRRRLSLDRRSGKLMNRRGGRITPGHYLD